MSADGYWEMIKRTGFQERKLRGEYGNGVILHVVLLTLQFAREFIRVLFLPRCAAVDLQTESQRTLRATSTAPITVPASSMCPLIRFEQLR